MVGSRALFASIFSLILILSISQSFPVSAQTTNPCDVNNGGCSTNPLVSCTPLSTGGRICGPCPTGFSGNGTGPCISIDFCATNNGGCDPLQTCTNTFGAHVCGPCPSGYTENSSGRCILLNVCGTNNGGCSPLVTCTNLGNGQRICGPCPTGFTGNGTSCTPINACTVTKNGGCDPLTKCIPSGNSRVCGSCPAGTYSTTGNGLSTCTQAPAGSYVSLPDSKSATGCSVGTYQPNTGQSSCIQADPGYFVAGTNATAETLCAPGTFASTPDSASCTPAPAGSYVSTSGATSATVCAAGTFSSTTGGTSCTQAPAGSYVGAAAATSYTLCPAGTYCPNPGTITPLSCPAGDFCGMGTITPSPQTESLLPSTGGGHVAFSSNAGGFSSLTAVSQSSLSTPPPPGSYPFGFFSWTITGLPVGGSATVQMTYPSNPGAIYEKLIGTTWFQIPVTETTLTNGSVVVSMTLTDGASGQDSDQAANGQISDPGGLLAATQGRVTGGGSIGKDTNFGFDVSSKDGKTFRGHLEYHAKTSHVDLDSNKITQLFVDGTMTHAIFAGQTTVDHDDHDNKKTPSQMLTFLVTVTDPDKKGDRDTFSINVTNSTGNIVYQNSGTVKGHIEIHHIDTDDDSGHNDNNEKNSK
ncbi:MAG: hypothetical protein KGI11_08120 [Thaumarchaeota archaeon]|nr:hypothetical protein [Nitrososphaerota archaeon]